MENKSPKVIEDTTESKQDFISLNFMFDSRDS